MKSIISHSDLVRARTDDFETIGKVSTLSVHKGTGKHWKQWVSLLEKAGAGSWTHQEIVAFLKAKHRLTVWWQQGVATGFEVAIGRRKPGQDAKGKYMVTATKSLNLSTAKAWRWLVSRPGLEAWMMPLVEVEIGAGAQFETSDGFFGEIRTVASGRRVRMFWQDPNWEKHTVLELMLVPRPGGRRSGFASRSNRRLAGLPVGGVVFQERGRLAQR